MSKCSLTLFVIVCYVLVCRIQRKEFSNDPTVELNEISETFQQKLVSVKRDLEALAGLVAQQKQQHKQRRSGAHSDQHWAYILSGLQQQVSADIATFQVCENCDCDCCGCCCV